MAVAEPCSIAARIRKLDAVLFEQSRDQWKEKCQDAKRENNKLKVRLSAMRKSRDRWKAKTKELEEELTALESRSGSRSDKKAPVSKFPQPPMCPRVRCRPRGGPDTPVPRHQFFVA